MLMIPPPPPALSDLPRGYELAAGLGRSTVLPDLDFETYSEAGYVWTGSKWAGPPGAPGTTRGLPVVGAAVYAAHPTAEILLAAYDLKDGRGRRRWRKGMPPPLDLFDYLASGGLLEAWNVGFERWMWELVAVPRLRWPAVHPSQWRCAAAKARAFALPGSLAGAGAVLDIEAKKDPEGVRLMKRFSMPHNPTQADPRPRIPMVWTPVDFAEAAAAGVKPKVIAEYMADSEAYAGYNERDIEAEAEASSLIPDLEGEELAWWQVDQAINRRGVQIDLEAIDGCITVIEQAYARYHTELQALTGVDSATKVAQLQAWLRARGVHLDSLDEDSVAGALGTLRLEPDVRRVLEIRAAVGSASVKKVYAMRNRSLNGRMYDLFVYFGARTGRATGEGPQPTNSPKAGPDLLRCGLFHKGKLIGHGCGKHYSPLRPHCPYCGRVAPLRAPEGPDARLHEWSPEAAEEAIAVLKRGRLDSVELIFGDAMHTIAGCIRGLYIAAPGHDQISTDYNSIEAVGLAMISGERWRIEVFRTHGKIYEASASTMFGVEFSEFAAWKDRTGQHHPLRQKGKIGELAFGYQGWVGAAAAFGMPGTDSEIKADILRWREASPAVVWLWGGQTLRKAADIVASALRPAYEGEVAPVYAGLADIGVDRWDRSTYYFGVEGAAVQAVGDPGTEYPVRRLDGTDTGVVFLMRGDVLYCRIPSGRWLTYHRPRLENSDRGGLALSYEGNNTNPKNGPVGWIRMNTWGGRLVENINQATCRDILRFACINLEAHGYSVVLHVYDEIVCEIPEGFGSLEQFEAVVTQRPPWAHDWPIRAPGPWRAKRYRKG